MVRFRIANMRCGGCARGVTATLKGVDPDAELRVDLQHREVSVERTRADPAALEAALASAGWRCERKAA
jgi:copper chaperone